MLKTVIQKKNVDGVLRFEAMAFGDSVLADTQLDAAPHRQFHQLDFVASQFAPRCPLLSMATRFPVREKFFGELKSPWVFLPGAANRQIPTLMTVAFRRFCLNPFFGIQPNTPRPRP